MRVFLLGEKWDGSNARAFIGALHRLGVEVQDLDQHTYFPPVRHLSSRIMFRLMGRQLQKEYNEEILRRAAIFRPTILLAYKGAHVRPETLRQLRDRGIVLYNYYPDTSAFAHGSLLPQTCRNTIAFFTRNAFGMPTCAPAFRFATPFLMHGYDSDLCCSWPVIVDEEDRRQFGVDVLIIATHTAHKERVLSDL